jgi:hypothetical protein
MTALSKWIKASSYSGPPRPERRTAPGLAAYHWAGSGPRQFDIRDISSTGVYLLTRDRWVPGEVVSLTLQRHGPPEKVSERRFSVQARAVRWGDDGIGFSFVLPTGMDVRLWETDAKSEEDAAPGPDDILREFRKAGALSFLSRISPEAAREIAEFMHQGTSDFRILSAVEIALKTEELLAWAPDSSRLLAHPRVVVRIIEDGSWADPDWLQHFWANLLATSCTVMGNDESNLPYVYALSQLTPIHAQILAVVCSKSTEPRTEHGWTPSHPPSCSAQEIITRTDPREHVRIDRDLGHLSNLELIKKSEKSSRLATLEVADITPTRRGLELYARCNGHRGAVESYYAAFSTNLYDLANE